MNSPHSHLPAVDDWPDAPTLYRSIFDRALDGIAIIAPDGSYVEQNDAHARLTGWSTDELRGLTPAVHLGEAVFAEVVASLRRDGQYSGVVQSRGRDGTLRTVELAAFAVHNDAGAVIAYVGAKRDVTERHRAGLELRQRFTQLQAVYRMTDALARAADVEEIFREGMDCLCAALGASRASLLLFDSQGVMRFRAWRNLSDAYRQAVDGHSPWAAGETGAVPICVPDVMGDESLRDLHPVIAAEGIAAMAFVPLQYQGRLLGKFMIYFDEQHDFMHDEIRLAETIAGHLAIAIERRRSHDELYRSQREFEALAEHSPDIIVRFDRQLRHVYVNRAVEQATGRTSAEFIGRTNTELGMPPALAQQWETALARVFATGAAAELEFAFDTPQGSRHYLGRLNPEIVEGGVVQTVVATTRDVTELKRTELRQRLLAEVGAAVVRHLEYHEALEQVSRLVVQSFSSGCAIDIATPEGTLERVAVDARDPRHRAIVREIEERFPTPMDGTAGHVTAFRTGLPQLYEGLPDELLRAASATDEHFELWRALEMNAVYCVPLIARGRTIGVMTFVASGSQTGFTTEDVEFARELAERVALAVDNLRLFHESKAANHTKSNFMATMSHELRTPLNAIVGYADLLDLNISGPLTPGQTEHLARIRSSAHHLLTVIEEILTFSRVEAGKEDVRLDTVDAVQLASEAAVMVEAAAAGKGLDFHVQLPEQPIVLQTDAVKLRQVMINLLSNGVKFTDAGSVSLRVERTGREVCITVSDTGIGIAPEHLERIFDPFWQACSGSTRTTGGTGLGLTVSRQLTELLGGRLSASSQQGEGSTFEVRLPLAS